MKLHRLAFIAALGITSAAAQVNTPAPPPAAGPGNTAGIAPPAPAVQVAPTATIDTDVGGQQQGFFAPSIAEGVVVPGFTPATPGVTPLDSPTNATVGSSPSDRSLRDSISSALADDPALQGARINVTVSNGVVSLTGTARDTSQAARARQVVEGVAGTARVNASIAPG